MLRTCYFTASWLFGKEAHLAVVVLSYLIGTFPGHLLSGPDARADVLLGGAHLLAQHPFCQWGQNHAGTTLLRESLVPFMLSTFALGRAIGYTSAVSGGRYGADESGATETGAGEESGHGCHQRGHGGSLNISIFFFFTVHTFAALQTGFNNKTLNQTCSQGIYFCSCSNHLKSSSMYRPGTKNHNDTSLLQNKQE